ncbi:MAG: peptide chain release factor N(5)-glutamine methyltransferase [Albidovulum sp.]|nr:peptide chain release factor N(5)-glutamine methyltransferase [Albidovulum sp.]
MTESVSSALERAVSELNAAGVPDAVVDARYLMAHALGQSSALLSARHEGMRLSEAARVRFESALESRLQRKPVSQIVGYRAFWNQSFRIDGHVLDPRPESEVLVEQAIKSSPKRILDMGTGSGCILLAILSECPEANGVGIDCSAAALATASGNAEYLGLSDRAGFLQSDWFSRVEGKYDLIVSNPPYVSESEYADLDPEIRLWEPEIALKAGESGLDAFRKLAAGARDFLLPEGELMVEIGRGQARGVRTVFENEGYAEIRASRDLDKRIRVIGFEWPSSAENRC